MHSKSSLGTTIPFGVVTAAPDAVRARRTIRWFFILLIPALFLQLPLRRKFEFYPAIVMPAGAGVVRDDGHCIVGHEKQCYAEDTASQLHPVSIDGILDTVPFVYRQFVVNRGFGINMPRDEWHKTLKAGGTNIYIHLGRPLTPTQIAETQAWLRRKLSNRFGIEAVRLKIETYEIRTFYDSAPIRKERRLVDLTTIELQGGEK